MHEFIVYYVLIYLFLIFCLLLDVVFFLVYYGEYRTLVVWFSLVNICALVYKH